MLRTAPGNNKLAKLIGNWQKNRYFIITLITLGWGINSVFLKQGRRNLFYNNSMIIFALTGSVVKSLAKLVIFLICVDWNIFFTTLVFFFIFVRVFISCKIRLADKSDRGTRNPDLSDLIVNIVYNQLLTVAVI